MKEGCAKSKLREWNEIPKLLHCRKFKNELKDRSKTQNQYL
jgi:hypothetical protein